MVSWGRWSSSLSSWTHGDSWSLVVLLISVSQCYCHRFEVASSSFLLSWCTLSDLFSLVQTVSDNSCARPWWRWWCWRLHVTLFLRWQCGNRRHFKIMMSCSISCWKCFKQFKEYFKQLSKHLKNISNNCRNIERMFVTMFSKTETLKQCLYQNRNFVTMFVRDFWGKSPPGFLKTPKFSVLGSSVLGFRG